MTYSNTITKVIDKPSSKEEVQNRHVKVDRKSDKGKRINPEEEQAKKETQFNDKSRSKTYQIIENDVDFWF